MSLEPTHTQIGERPGKMGVTVAASGRELESDVQRKMKLWGVVEAFMDGRMPDNTQIDHALNHMIHTSPVDVHKLSLDGKVLIEDARDIIETLRMMVVEKNDDELFQNAVYSSYKGDGSRAKQSGVLPVGKGDVQGDANQAAAHLRVLITLFVTNSEFRKILSDFGLIGRDVFATVATKAADSARPSQNQLDQVDQEAPSNQWAGADGKTHGQNDTPELQMRGPSGSQIKYNPKDAPGNAQVTDTSGNSRSAGQAYHEGQQAKEDAKSQARDAKDSAKGQAQSHAQGMNSSRDPNASYSEQKEQLRGAANQKAGEANQSTPDVDREGAKNQAREKGNQLMNKVPEHHRQRFNDGVDQTKGIFNDAMPQERRDQFIYRLKKVVVECQGHKDYMEAMSWLLDTLENYQGHASHVAHKGSDSAGALTDDPSINDSTIRFRVLLERFANGKSMDGMYNALDQIYSDSRHDQELRRWFTRLNEYAHRALLEPGWILDEESNHEANELRDSGRSFFSDKYRGHQQRLFDEIQLWFTAMGDDPLNVRLGDDIKRLTKDLLFNSEGNLTFKPKLWNDIRNVILPTIIRQIGYVPIPRAEYSDDKIDLVIENLILSGPNLFPNVVEMEANNHFKFSPYQTINRTMDTHHHRFRLGLSQIQADIRDVNFAFRRKSGWPKLADSGIADVVLAGQGISIDVELESVEHRRNSVFRVNHVNVKLDTLKFSIRDSKHDMLYKFVKTVATGTIKKAITVAVQMAMKSALENLDDQLVQVRGAMDEAKRSDETTRSQALKDLYAKKKETGQERTQKADEKTGTFKLVTDRDSQLNPDFTHDSKNSISKRLFKTQDLANSGREWRSPAFDLFDSKHPAVSGRHHPEAQQGAGSGNAKTSAVAGARGEIPQSTGSSNAGHMGGAGAMGAAGGYATTGSTGTRTGDYGNTGNYGNTGDYGNTGGYGNTGATTGNVLGANTGAHGTGVPGSGIQEGAYEQGYAKGQAVAQNMQSDPALERRI